MKLPLFLLIQIISLGTFGFLSWMLMAVSFGENLRLNKDTLGAWGFSIVIVGLFLVLIALPTQIAASRLSKLSRLAAGAIVGPITWIVAISISSRHPVSIEWLSRGWSLYLTFSLIGMLFSWAWINRSAA